MKVLSRGLGLNCFSVLFFIILPLGKLVGQKVNYTNGQHTTNHPKNVTKISD